MIPSLKRRTLLAGGLAGGGLAVLGRGAYAQETPRRGGVLNVAYNTEQANLNPALVASNAVYLVASKVIEPLVEMDAGGRFIPLLATAWEPAADGRSITFRLRRGVKWHDGRDFTSADVQFSAMEIWKALQNFGRVTFRDLEAVQTPDPLTAVFRFSRPTPAQLIMNALPALSAVVPKHLYENTDIRNNPRNTMPIGTGPFKLTENRRGQFVVLERNAEYWDAPKPYLDRIVFRVMTDKAAIAAAHEAGEIDLSCFSSIPIADIRRLAALPRLEVTERGYEGAAYHVTIEFNMRRPQLANPMVRRAIAHAIDAEAAVRTVFEGYGRVGTGPVPSYDPVFYTADNVPRYRFNVEQANQLLDQAGFPRGAAGTRFPLRLIPAPWFEYTRLMGDFLAQSLRRVGIQPEMQVYDPGAHLGVVYRDHNFDITTGSHAYRNDPAISTTILYETGTPAGVPWSNQFGYANPAMDQLIQTAANELDGARRIQHYRRFQQLAQEDLPLIPAIEHSFVSVVDRRLRAHHNNPRWAMANWADLWRTA